jgi:hypothetical protein
VRRAIVALAVAVAGCSVPVDLGTVRPRDPPADMDHEWTLVTVEGMIPAPALTPPDFVEIDPDGRAMTVYFRGGNTGCYGVAGVEVERRDPVLPIVNVLYGVRFGNIGCSAEGTFLAIRQSLEPPFEP